MAVRVNDIAPDFKANTSQGEVSFHDWIGDGWAMLFSHPKDFTPVCATELSSVAKLSSEFAARGCKVIGLSVDKVDDHMKWASEIEDLAGVPLNFPLIADENLGIAKLYDMFPAEESGTAGERTAATNATARSVFIIGPDKSIKLTLTYPMTTGRNFHEILRALDSMQLTAKHKVATPANWTQGDDVIIVPSVSDDDAKKMFSGGWQTVKPYLRVVKQPS